MTRHCKIIVLPEDSRHADLARGFFRGRNVNERAYELQRKWTGRDGNNAAVVRWLCEEAKLQSRRTSARYGILAIIDEDGKGLVQCRTEINKALSDSRLPETDPNEGRCLILPKRNVETWMVWLARWQTSGSPSSPDTTGSYTPVDETSDYKKWRSEAGEPVPKESMADAYQVGKILATLNPAVPPAATPAALREALKELGQFLRWCKL